jgi:hypothetical protein
MQGVWSFAMLTPLERPDELAGKDVLTEKEAARAVLLVVVGEPWRQYRFFSSMPL